MKLKENNLSFLQFRALLSLKTAKNSLKTGIVVASGNFFSVSPQMSEGGSPAGAGRGGIDRGSPPLPARRPRKTPWKIKKWKLKVDFAIRVEF